MSAGRILISGYYGFDNAGDEAVLAGLIKGLHRVRKGPVPITVLSGDPGSTARDHGVLALHRYRLPELVRGLVGCDLFMSGGGSLLQDVTSAHSIFYYLAVVRVAQILGKKTMFAAQGIGPLNLKRSQRLVASVAGRLDCLSVRDPESKALLESIGVRSPTIVVTADPAILLGEHRTLPSDKLGVSLRPWRDHAIASTVADALARSTCRAPVVPISMQPQSDGPVMEQFVSFDHQIKQSSETGTGKHQNRLYHLIEEISGCEIVIGMRLHALILAAACGVPSIGIGYDPKIASFMKASGQDDSWSDLSTIEPESFGNLITTVWDERLIRSEALRAILPRLSQDALRTAELALDLT